MIFEYEWEGCCNVTVQLLRKSSKGLLDIWEFDREDYFGNIISVTNFADEEWEDLPPEGILPDINNVEFNIFD